MNCHTTNISKYVQISSYVKGIQDFFKKLENKKDIPEESILVTLDIKSLCTDIRNNTRTKVVRESCEKYKEKRVSAKVIITFLSSSFILIPVQTSLWQIIKLNYIYLSITETLLLYLRYNDDIFIVYP